MKLHTKLILWLLSALTVVVCGAQFVQYLDTTKRLRNQAQASIEMLEHRERENAENVHRSIEQSIAGSLQRGEMTKFTKLLEQQKQVKGLLEFSLFDQNGKVSHSSDSDNIARELPETIKQDLLTDPNGRMLVSDETLEIYTPQVNTGDCIRCHTSWREGDISGVTYFKFSTADLAQAKIQAQHNIRSARSYAFRSGLVTVLGIVTVLAVTMYVIVKKFVRTPLGLFVELLERFEKDEGDLTTRIPIQRRDEIGLMAKLFNGFIGNLNQVIGQAQKAGRQVGSEAGKQAEMVKQTSTSVEEIDQKTSQNASRAQEANEQITAMTSVISQADETMTSLTASMGEISRFTSETREIVQAIDGIAQQTNLLALNAAVEAARAGEAGKGFAIVSEAVRTLALQSGDSARKITEMISETVDRINEGAKLADSTSEAFSQIVARNGKASELIHQIAQASDEQSADIAMVSKTLSQLDKAAQQNAAEAGELAQTMSKFKSNYTEQTQHVATGIQPANAHMR